MGASRELWPDEYTVFNILYDKFLFWSIVVGLFTFAWLLIAILRYRDGIEPSGKEEIKVGTFPKERHHFDLELAWFVGPTILVIWVTILAFGSMNIVWGEVQKLQEDPDTFTVEVNGLQWYWDFYYHDELTWEDMDTGHDVTWDNITGLTIDAGPSAATAVAKWSIKEVNIDDTVKITEFTETLDLANNTTMDILFDKTVPHSVEIQDAEGNVVHRWQHIPDRILDNDGTELYSYKMNRNLIIPCDENVLFNIYSMNPVRDANFDATNTYQGVQHAFWLQEWGMKEDAVPGLDSGTWMYVQPNEAGVFPIRCAEYCGKEHSLMYGQVEVVAREGETCDEDFGVYFDHEELR